MCYPDQNQQEICIREQTYARVDNENLRGIIRRCKILEEFKNLGNKLFHSWSPQPGSGYRGHTPEVGSVLSI